jgi:hypothetical protein
MIRALGSDNCISQSPLFKSLFFPFSLLNKYLSVSFPFLSIFPRPSLLSVPLLLTLFVFIFPVKVTRAKGTDKQSLLLQMGKVGEEVDTALKKMRVMQVCVV